MPWSAAPGRWPSAADDGRTVQVGGWGFLLGDEGGGYWVVREALRVLLDRRDHDEPHGQLGKDLMAATGAEDLAALHRLVYQQPHRPSDWARHASLVLDSADPAAAAIAARAADAAASLAAAAVRELDSPRTLPVVLAGGLLGNAAFRHAARQAVAQALPRAEVTVLADEPVAGADPAGPAGRAGQIFLRTSSASSGLSLLSATRATFSAWLRCASAASLPDVPTWMPKNAPMMVPTTVATEATTAATSAAAVNR